MNIKGVNYGNYNKINSECTTCHTHYCSVMSKHQVRLYYSLYISTTWTWLCQDLLTCCPNGCYLSYFGISSNKRLENPTIGHQRCIPKWGIEGKSLYAATWGVLRWYRLNLYMLWSICLYQVGWWRCGDTHSLGWWYSPILVIWWAHWANNIRYTKCMGGYNSWRTYQDCRHWNNPDWWLYYYITKDVHLIYPRMRRLQWDQQCSNTIRS